MSEIDKNWEKFQKNYNLDHLEDPNANQFPKVFEEDQMVLADTFEEACEVLEAVALEKYNNIVELASKIFCDLDNLRDQISDVRDYQLSKLYSYYEKESWMQRQNEIAELQSDDVSRHKIYQIESSAKKYYPELKNSKSLAIQHLADRVSNILVEGDLANLMAYLNAVISNPKKYITISEDEQGDAPF